nr:MAG TPA: hypothetical protein [Caudoviricetes sp.]
MPFSLTTKNYFLKKLIILPRCANVYHDAPNGIWFLQNTIVFL